MIKSVHKLGKEGNFPDPKKDISEQHTTNIIFNSERINALSLRSGVREGRMSSLTTCIQHFIGYLARAIRQGEKKKKDIQIGKEVKLPLFSCYVILYIENPKESTKNYFNCQLSLA